MSDNPNFYYGPIKDNRLLDLELCAILAREKGLISQARLAELLNESLYDLMATGIIEKKKAAWKEMNERRLNERLGKRNYIITRVVNWRNKRRPHATTTT